MIKRHLVFIVFVLCLGFSRHAKADGKVFSHAIAVPVSTPDQRALLSFSNGTERLVIETSFVGQGTNFAWIVPFPSQPKVEAVSTNFFPLLNRSFQPKLIYEMSFLWFIFLFVGGTLSISIIAYRQRGCFFSILAALLIFIFLIIVTIPNFIRSRGIPPEPAASSVRVLEQQSVGVYDVVTLTGEKGSDLLAWLNDNRFYVSTNSTSVISSYATQHWVFVASRMRRDIAADARTQPHPLAFTFRTEEPVYPLRLTGVENDHCSIELFVFGPGRAEAVGFRAEYCGIPSFPTPTNESDPAANLALFRPSPAGKFRIGNPEIQTMAAPALVATKLTGTLNAEAMKSDASIRWVPFQEELPLFYSEGARFTASLDWIMGIVVVGLLTIQIATVKMESRRRFRLALYVCALAALCGFVRYATAKTIEIRVVRGRAWAANNFRQLDGAIQQFLLERTNTGTIAPEELRTNLGVYFGRGGDTPAKNTFSEEPLKMEASPGNLMLENVSNVQQILWYDFDGVGHVLVTITKTGGRIKVY